jgi:hypothetical protein
MRKLLLVLAITLAPFPAIADSSPVPEDAIVVVEDVVVAVPETSTEEVSLVAAPAASEAPEKPVVTELPPDQAFQKLVQAIFAKDWRSVAALLLILVAFGMRWVIPYLHNIGANAFKIYTFTGSVVAYAGTMLLAGIVWQEVLASILAYAIPAALALWTPPLPKSKPQPDVGTPK